MLLCEGGVGDGGGRGTKKKAKEIFSAAVREVR